MSISTRNLIALSSAGLRRRRAGGALVDAILATLGVLLIAAIASVPMEPRQQAVFAAGTIIVFLAANRVAGRAMTVFLIALSLAVSLRYIFWRVTETLQFGSWTEMFFGVGLALAEVYAIIVLVLGYVQTTWPLDRRPLPLPPDPQTWPTVDVYIPTYNEPMSIVRGTVLAAMAMDWPPDRFRVYILDDGRREEFRVFADEVGCGYITRTDNFHAKAGNLNAAMTKTDGEFITVFDCDHIPTRAFLQFTLGWLAADPKIAMVQTPHHFYSPDPFQRNLAAGTRVPAEGNMFYGLVQDGNDFWNAAFFCGSCAVIRRKALESIGGFAVETVTEDAHTMLKLHRRGWESAYLKLPLAAGLATERLSLHIGQRMRWARGMLQIMRIDNPLFGPGLTLGQRICYLQATGHFLFAIPRVVFLSAPLAFLLLGQNVITASPLAITAYAFPHIFHSVATNSRLQKSWRHSFWSEIYETVLALFLVRLTVVTLISPRRGKFNVTAKGGLLENGFFDLRAVYPNLILAFALILGIGRGLVGMTLFHTDTLTFQALLLNSIWAIFSLLVVLAALAVGRETRQLRSRARVAAMLPVSLVLPNGRSVRGSTRDLSQGGANLMAERPADMRDEVTNIQVVCALGGQNLVLPAQVVRWERWSLRLRWQPTTLAEEADIVRMVFGRADAWTDWSAYPVDQPLVSLWRVLVSIKGLFRPREVPAALAAGATPGADGAAKPAAASRRGSQRAAAAVALLLLAVAPAAAQTESVQTAQRDAVPMPPTPLQLQPATPQPGQPQAQPKRNSGNGMTVRVIPQVAPAPNLPSVRVVPPTPGSAAAAPLPPPGSAPVVAAPPIPTVADAAGRSGVRRVVYNLRQLGASGPLALRGTSQLQGVEFGIRSDEVVTAAQISLTGAASSSLIPELSNITVTLNEQYVGTVPISRDQQNLQIDMPVSPVFFQDNNRLNFRFTGRYTQECNDPLSGLLWATVYDSSTLTLMLERLPPQRDLARLPLPFFDRLQKDPLALPFVLGVGAGNEALKAAGIVASWFGQLASYRGAGFQVVPDAPATGNAVVIVVGSEARGIAGLPPINGPTVAVVANPNDRLSSLLVVAGRNGDEVVTAATALVVGSPALGSEVALVQPPTVAPRLPYDAPNWIPTDRPVKLGELVDAADLQSFGYVGLLHVPFRTAPDFYTWRNRSFELNLRYRSPPGPIIDLQPSRLDVGINGFYLDTLSLAQADQAGGWLSRLFAQLGGRPSAAHIGVPVYDVFGSNDLQFFFDSRPLHRGDCTAVPQDLRMSVDPDSTIDLGAGHRFAELPNLAFFVNSGFPFTRMADLSETAIVLPERPSAGELSAFLDMMGRFGAITGYPAIRAMVLRPEGLTAAADRDVLMLGTLQRMQPAAELLNGSAVRMDGARLLISVSDPLDSVRRLFDDRPGAERDRAAATLSAGMSERTAVLVGGESPMRSGRSVVAVLASAPPALEGAVASLRDSVQAPLIQGDLALLSAGKVSSFRVTTPYTVGSLPFWMWPSWYLRDQPYGAIVVMLVGCALFGAALYWIMQRRADRRLRASAAGGGVGSPGRPGR
jgi:cellulose synthase (UDP-forming)